MGWAGHKLTDSGTGKGESDGKSLDNGTCLESLLACDSESMDLGEAGDDTGRPWRSRRRYLMVLKKSTILRCFEMTETLGELE